MRYVHHTTNVNGTKNRTSASYEVMHAVCQFTSSEDYDTSTIHPLVVHAILLLSETKSWCNVLSMDLFR